VSFSYPGCCVQKRATQPFERLSSCCVPLMRVLWPELGARVHLTVCCRLTPRESHDKPLQESENL
jgi:hypothetical protein